MCFICFIHYSVCTFGTNQNKTEQLGTKVKQFQTLYDMQLHEAQELVSLLEFLPSRYMSAVQSLIWKENKHIKAQVVRHTKSGYRKDNYVLSKLIEVAKAEKETIIANREKLRSELEKTRQSA